MASVIEKRRSLHRNLAQQQKQNDSLKLQNSQLHALANIGVTTCMMAHEINNLLTPAINYTSLAIANPDDKALAQKALEKTARNCEHVSKVMQSILSMVNGEAKEKKHTRLRTLVDEIFSCLCRDFTKDSIAVKIQIPDDLTVYAVPVDIQQVLMNLILNARDAMLPRGGALTIKADIISDKVQIEVADTGCGIEKDNLDKIFEPFFTTKKTKQASSQNSGFGLGLAFCRKIIDEHHGVISVESKPGTGTTFRIILSHTK